jgi:DNA-binding NtrC family response regulator
MSLSHRQRCRIVVTDDDPTLLAFVVTALRDDGHCVFAAYDAESACDLVLAIDQLELLVTNTRMGNVSARDLIAEVKRYRPDMAILHIGQPLPNHDGLLDDVPNLREPFTAEALVEEVRKLLSRRGART